MYRLHVLPQEVIRFAAVKAAAIFLRQHRTIVPASLSRLFAPLLQFEKREIHTVFLRFPNFELGQKSRLSLLVKLCGVALRKTAPVQAISV